MNDQHSREHTATQKTIWFSDRTYVQNRKKCTILLFKQHPIFSFPFNKKENIYCGCSYVLLGCGFASYFCISFAACTIIRGLHVLHKYRTKTFSLKVWDRKRERCAKYIDLGDRVVKLYTLGKADQSDSVCHRKTHRATNCITQNHSKTRTGASAK